MKKKPEPKAVDDVLILGIDQRIADEVAKGGVYIMPYQLDHIREGFKLLIATFIDGVVTDEEIKGAAKLAADEGQYLINMRLEKSAVPAFMQVANDSKGQAIGEGGYYYLDKQFDISDERGKHLSRLMVRYVHEKVGGEIIINQKVEAEIARRDAAKQAQLVKDNPELAKAKGVIKRGKMK